MGDVGYSNGRPEAGRSPERLDPVAAERSRLVEEATRAVVKLARVHGEADIIGAASSSQQEINVNSAEFKQTVEKTIARAAIWGARGSIDRRPPTQSDFELAS